MRAKGLDLLFSFAKILSPLGMSNRGTIKHILPFCLSFLSYLPVFSNSSLYVYPWWSSPKPQAVVQTPWLNKFATAVSNSLPQITTLPPSIWADNLRVNYVKYCTRPSCQCTPPEALVWNQPANIHSCNTPWMDGCAEVKQELWFEFTSLTFLFQCIYTWYAAWATP